MADRDLQAAIYASLQSCRGGGGSGGGGGGGLIAARGGGPVGAAHMAAARARQQARQASSAQSITLRQSRLANEGILPSADEGPRKGPGCVSSASRVPKAGRRAVSDRDLQQKALPAPAGMPSNLPEDADRMLSRRCAKQGIKELAVPLGDGWMQRAGRGTFDVSGGDGGASAEGKASVMTLESLEPNIYLLTYDQTPDAQATKGGHYCVEAAMRCLAGRDAPWAAVVLNWVRGRSTISAPCFTAVVLGANAWRVEQYVDGQRSVIAEVRDNSLKPGGNFQKIRLEVRGDRISLHVNHGGAPVFSSLSVPPISSTGAATARGASLCGPAGVAVFKSRAQLRRFHLSALDEGAGGAVRAPFTAGDPKLVEAIESEMLESSPNVAWDSVGGCEDAKRLLNEAVVLPLLIPDYFAAAACRAAWKGVLLFGPPGTGKTMLARAVASLGKTAFFNISASSLVSKFHGESEKLARTLFALARHHAPSVVFFDEIDALVSARGAAGESPPPSNRRARGPARPPLTLTLTLASIHT